ncbi:aldehyde dehydrogenase 22A1 [Actinidia rufa]|uniref:Aldehyde dehydrogenase 22A1 n=1 Tax=Actinidia rufa TaxID=165716 RepID=A0A7J0GTN1_9ERIC|nr:aldehyde dehydrogenase 22A1 [Actinidia rufa]
MAFWWPLLVLGFAFAICRFLLMFIPPNVPSIDVDASDMLDDGNQTKEKQLHLYFKVFVFGRSLNVSIGKSMQIPSKRHTDKVQCYEPATMKYLGYFSELQPDEVKERVAQARKAQKIWAESSFKQRRRFLRILLKYVVEHQELICESSGRSMLHKSSKVEFYPLGVIGAIVSWNYPFHNIFNPMLAAVFSGNGIVIKVSEHASWSGCFYLRIIQAALTAVGAPENLVDVITGFAETGQALVSSVDKVIFVGSPGVGRMIMRNAAETLTPVTLELGGKDSFVVCEDVDVPHVAQVAVRAALQSSGQNCAGAERFYVHRDIYSSFVAEVVKIVKSITAGPPLAGKYDMGAICMQEHSEKLQSLVNDALDKGAEIVGRGSVGNIGAGAVDHYFPPTVIVNVNHTMKLLQEEAFGPILPIMKFSSDKEAVKLANDSNYGLGCAVFSANQRRAKRIASQIVCGVAAINDFASNYMCQSLPFGGIKDSGFGRFAGVEGLRACCLVKSVVEDRWWPHIKTKIPKIIQYPVAENGFEFQESLVEALYGLNVWDRLRALVNVLKLLSEHNTNPSTKRKND